MSAAGPGRRALLISENAPVPGDRRVWNQSRALVEAGGSVAVVCAAAEDREEAPTETIEGVEIHRYPLRPAAGGQTQPVRAEHRHVHRN